MPALLPALAGLHGRYDALLCDIWGVVHNGRRAYAPACAALSAFRGEGGRVALVSNVPKPNEAIPAQLARLGVPDAAWDIIVTSGDAIREELRRRAPGPMYKIGPAYDAELWEGLGLDLAPLETAAFVGVSGLNDEGRETPVDYAAILAAAKARDLDLVCANPDLVVRVGDRMIHCAGALAQAYTAIGGRVVMAGKPCGPIYRLAYARLEALMGRSLPRNRLLAIGDGLGTDVLGANREGLDVLFIAGGMHGAGLLKADGAPDLAAVTQALDAEGAHATYVAAELA